MRCCWLVVIVWAGTVMIGVDVVVVIGCGGPDFAGVAVVVIESSIDRFADPIAAIGPVAVDTLAPESFSAPDLWPILVEPSCFALPRSSITTLPLGSSFGTLGEAVVVVMVVVASVVEIIAGDVVVVDAVDVSLPGEVPSGGDCVCGDAVVVVVASPDCMTPIGAVDIDGSCARWPIIIILISTSIGTVIAVSLSRAPRLVSNPMPIGTLPLVIGCLSRSNSLSICIPSTPPVAVVVVLSVKLRVESTSVAPVAAFATIEPAPAFGKRSMSMI